MSINSIASSPSIENARNGQELNQTQQRLRVREQEISALKIQNRHLLAKLEDSEKNGKPNQINTQLVANEVQKNLQPVLGEIEKSLKTAFDMLQTTLRGIYQQSSRAQEAVEEMTQHTRDIQNHMQEKVTIAMGNFCDRLERQMLARLNGVDTMVQKQNEMLHDLETMKVSILNMQKNSDQNRLEVSRIEKESIEANQKLIEAQLQARTSEEVTRDALQQLRNHRAEFKLLRGEVRSVLENSTRLNDKVSVIDERLLENSGELEARQREHLSNELRGLDGIGSIEDLISIKNENIQEIENVLQTGNNAKASKEDLTMVLELLQAQKADLKRVAEDAATYLRAESGSENSIGATRLASDREENEGNSDSNRLEAEAIHIVDLNSDSEVDVVPNGEAKHS